MYTINKRNYKAYPESNGPKSVHGFQHSRKNQDIYHTFCNILAKKYPIRSQTQRPNLPGYKHVKSMKLLFATNYSSTTIDHSNIY